MIKRYIVLYILCALSPFVYAQPLHTINGKITDAGSREPVNNASVTLLSTKHTVISGDDGRFKIEKEGYPAADIYNVYREKYNWKPSVILPEGATWIDFGFTNYNGEQENLFDQSLKENTYKSRAVPKTYTGRVFSI